MKIYVITKGAYSDYHICAVATDKKKAEILRKAFSDDWNEAQIETYETDRFKDFLKVGALRDMALRCGLKMKTMLVRLLQIR